MEKIILPLILIAGTISPASQGYTIFGAGTLSCDKWIEERSQNSGLSFGMETWILGFLTGAGWQGANPQDVDNSALYVWVDNFCRENPLKNITSASAALTIELEK